MIQSCSPIKRGIGMYQKVNALSVLSAEEVVPLKGSSVKVIPSAVVAT